MSTCLQAGCLSSQPPLLTWSQAILGPSPLPVQHEWICQAVVLKQLIIPNINIMLIKHRGTNWRTKPPHASWDRAKWPTHTPKESQRQTRTPNTGWLGAKSRSYQTCEHESGTCQLPCCHLCLRVCASQKFQQRIESGIQEKTGWYEELGNEYMWGQGYTVERED